MQCSVPFEQQSLCLQRWDNGLQRWVYSSCTVRFVYRIFEYSFVLGIFDSLAFRIFVLALLYTTVPVPHTGKFGGVLIWQLAVWGKIAKLNSNYIKPTIQAGWPATRVHTITHSTSTSRWLYILQRTQCQ